MSNQQGEIYLGGPGEPPVEKPFDPDYAAKVEAADKAKIGPDQVEIPESVLTFDGPEHDPEYVSKALAGEEPNVVVTQPQTTQQNVSVEESSTS